jgi:hypothetical protein
MLNELAAVLWKNFLLKRCNPLAFLFEVTIPIIFLSLLILIKFQSDKYISPNISYYCGNAFPWFYSDSVNTHANPMISPPFECALKPKTCDINGFYRDKVDVPIPLVHETISGYTQYGKQKTFTSNSTQF